VHAQQTVRSSSSAELQEFETENRALILYVANAVFTRVSLRLVQHPERCCSRCPRQCCCRRDDVRHWFAWRRPSRLAHHGTGFAIAHQIRGSQGCHPCRSGAALLAGLLNGFHLTPELYHDHHSPAAPGGLASGCQDGQPAAPSHRSASGGSGPGPVPIQAVSL